MFPPPLAGPQPRPAALGIRQRADMRLRSDKTGFERSSATNRNVRPLARERCVARVSRGAWRGPPARPVLAGDVTDELR